MIWRLLRDLAGDGPMVWYQLGVIVLLVVFAGVAIGALIVGVAL